MARSATLQTAEKLLDRHIRPAQHSLPDLLLPWPSAALGASQYEKPTWSLRAGILRFSTEAYVAEPNFQQLDRRLTGHSRRSSEVRIEPRRSGIGPHDGSKPSPGMSTSIC